jgi:hypothetical protein
MEDKIIETVILREDDEGNFFCGNGCKRVDRLDFYVDRREQMSIALTYNMNDIRCKYCDDKNAQTVNVYIDKDKEQDFVNGLKTIISKIEDRWFIIGSQ